MEKFFITTPIYYVNDKPHIGHAYTTFVCDTLARYYRMLGARVLFSTGVDENSQKNIEAMIAAGESDIARYLDNMAGLWKQSWDDLGIRYDAFIRTTEQRHVNAVQRFWRAAMETGDIYKSVYKGMYCTGCEAFKTESETENGACVLHPNKPLKPIEEENYFFKLSAYRDRLLELYSQSREFAMPEARRNEIRNYVENHLADISVSRSSSSLESGIPVPDNDSQRIYVWFDALINYLTVAGYGSDDRETEQWWPADAHIVGKDIIKFHCALWPAMLWSAAKTDPLLKKMSEEGKLIPRTVFAHGFFTIDGIKISKSLGNAVDPRDLIPAYGLDAIRYFLMREIPFGEDGDFSRKRLEERYVSDLANTLGNLLHRAISMSRRYFNGMTPNVDLVRAGASPNASVWDGAAGLRDLESRYDGFMQEFRIDLALERLWAAGEIKASGLLQANKFVEETKPFQLVKDDAMKVGEILYALLEACRHYAWLLAPVMPETAKAMIESLGQKFDIESKKSLEELRQWGGLPMDTPLPEPKPLFPKREATS
ncbi:methionine--tRNA ligase [candidate division WWE3 bacterium]|uniref:Methionine--tRNA ligase n=1 Tax=candidate division WWE3 bacterium TaxID=2053526 RepID=A0A928TT91_UNCKA|nr:methionine--tRNA ligase [candidate division WWE3 bacterium]